MEVEFNDFLSQLGRDTVSRIKKEQPKKKVESVDEEESVEENHSVVIENSIKSEVKPEVLNEDFLAQALDYANIVLKSVRGSFESQQERKKVCESIRNAMNFYLNESESFKRTILPQKQMTEKDWNKIPVVQNPSKPVETQTSESVGYKNPESNMSLNSDNSVNLSQLTTEDISDFRALAGIT